MDAPIQNRPPSEAISLRELIDVLWRGKWLILFFAASSMLAAAAAAWLLPEKYRATVVLSPVSDAPGGVGQLGGLGSLATQFGGLAALAGITVGNDLRKSESLAVLQSQALTERYIRENDLLPVLYSSMWDEKKKQWKTTDPEKVPTLWKANEDFKKKIRTVSTDTKTGLVTLSITWKDPETAARWANDLVKMTNDYMRNRAIAESERNIAYLDSQADKTDKVGVRQAIYAILQNELNKAMLARGSEEYAFKILDAAKPPEKPASPRPVLWIAVALAASLFLSLLIAFARVAWSRG